MHTDTLSTGGPHYVHGESMQSADVRLCTAIGPQSAPVSSIAVSFEQSTSTL